MTKKMFFLIALLVSVIFLFAVSCEDKSDGSTGPYYLDIDGDGYGQSDDLSTVITGDYTATSGGDCDDSDDEINPGEIETCDGKDNDCDEETDEGITCDCYPVGKTEDVACGNCGSLERTCQSDHTWQNTGVCENQGECTPGITRGCGSGRIETCTSLCGWGPCGG